MSLAQDTYSQDYIRIVSARIAAGAANADYDAALFIADRAYEVIAVTETHQTLGTDAGAVTLDVVKAASGIARASGTSVLAAVLSLKTTINVPQSATVNATAATRRLALGDSLFLNGGGTMTAVDGVYIQITLRGI